MHPDRGWASVWNIVHYDCDIMCHATGSLQGLCKTYYAGIKRKNEVIPTWLLYIIVVYSKPSYVMSDYVIVYNNIVTSYCCIINVQEIFIRDCVVINAGTEKRKNPYIAKIASIWREPGKGWITKLSLLTSILVSLWLLLRGRPQHWRCSYYSQIIRSCTFFNLVWPWVSLWW